MKDTIQTKKPSKYTGIEMMKFYEENNLHPEYYALSKLSYNYFITIKETTDNGLFTAIGGNAESFRIETVNSFMNYFRSRLRLRAKEIVWVWCEEYGISQCGHVHILVKILKEERRDVVEMADCSEFRLPKYKSLLFDIDVQSIGNSTNDQEKVVSYFCKKEARYKEKKFLFSPKFIGKVPELSECMNLKSSSSLNTEILSCITETLSISEHTGMENNVDLKLTA
jgi:hypothetical protein